MESPMLRFHRQGAERYQGPCRNDSDLWSEALFSSHWRLTSQLRLGFQLWLGCQFRHPRCAPKVREMKCALGSTWLWKKALWILWLLPFLPLLLSAHYHWISLPIFTETFWAWKKMSLHLAKSKVCQDRWLLKSEYHVRSCQIRNKEANFF